MNTYFDINEALVLLKEKAILKDSFNTKFIGRKNGVLVWSNNSSYNLKFNDFIELFKETKFMLDECEDNGIDLEKDKEYYNFKHK